MIYLIPTDTCYGIGCPVSEVKDYHKIYKIKKRSYDKPLALMVPDFSWLESNTDLSSEQIDFLKNYDKPFTVLTECSYLSAWMNYIDEDNNEFINRDVYQKFAFRVAHNNTQKKLLKQVGPIFLTSANLSGKPELQHSKDVRKEFEYYLDKKIVEFLGENTGIIDGEYSSSDIFEFIDDSTEVQYHRQNKNKTA